MNPDTDALRTLFASPFSPGKWTEVLAGLFGVRHAADGQLLERPRPVAVPDADGFFLGRFTTSDGYLVGLFRCEIAAGSVLRRRVGLRNLVHRYLGTDFDAALTVFTERGSGAWRFSFICDLKGEATAPKRFTYVFGVPGIPLRTPVGRFAALAASREPDSPVSMAAMRDAFSVEALSDEFFAAYKEHYETFVARITGKRFVKQGGKWVETASGRPDRDLYRTFGNDDKRVRDYVKKMLGRLVFLHFLQKKGWLGARGAGWTGGDPAFLLNLFEKATPAQQDDFLDGILENLFFNALNTDRSARGDLFDTGVPGIGECRIPYLNGGLFERDDLDDLRVRFPAAYFRDLLRFFSEYNFTIDENDADEAEVGIDPEMLGRIFENLLEDNKDKGAFYTPKEIVRYMCRRSLLAHLAEGEKEKDAASIAAFLETRDPAPLPQTLASRLAAKLRDIKICDPAIGSGAFPMGLLRELHDLRTALEPATPGLKRQIIENSIYGVDIEKGAVDIARLRFWLALVVDADSPTPLPNLDFKIMQGNSLVESWKGHDLSKLTERKIVGEQLLLLENEADIQRKRLRDLLHQWFACSDHRERAALRAKIHMAVEDQIRTFWPGFSFGELDPSANPEFFLWHLWFAEVFEKGGFDIVIGNPPYIQLQANGGALAALYKDKGFQSFFRMGDIYCLFYEQAIRIARPGGIVALITPNTWLQSIKFDAFRRYLLNAADLFRTLLTKNVFEAVVDTDVFFFKTGVPSKECVVEKQEEVGLIPPRITIISEKARSGGLLNLVAHNTAALIAEGILQECIGFGDLFDISCGVKPFQKGKGVPKQTSEIVKTKPFVVEGKRPSKEWRPLMRGSLMGRYENHWHQDYWIKYGPWLAEPRNPYYFDSPQKIIIRQTGDRIVATSLAGGIICRDNLYVLVPQSSYSLALCLGILNSRLMDFIYTYLNPEKGEALAQVKRQHVAMLPFPKKVDKEIAAKLIFLVNRILTTKAKSAEADTTSDERRIDELVYKLYGLTSEEIAVVESSAL